MAEGGEASHCLPCTDKMAVLCIPLMGVGLILLGFITCPARPLCQPPWPAGRFLRLVSVPPSHPAWPAQPLLGPASPPPWPVAPPPASSGSGGILPSTPFPQPPTGGVPERSRRGAPALSSGGWPAATHGSAGAGSRLRGRPSSASLQSGCHKLIAGVSSVRPRARVARRAAPPVMKRFSL